MHIYRSIIKTKAERSIAGWVNRFGVTEPKSSTANHLSSNSPHSSNAQARDASREFPVRKRRQPWSLPLGSQSKYPVLDRAPAAGSCFRAHRYVGRTLSASTWMGRGPATKTAD